MEGWVFSSAFASCLPEGVGFVWPYAPGYDVYPHLRLTTESADHGLNTWAKTNLLCSILFLGCLAQQWQMFHPFMKISPTRSTSEAMVQLWVWLAHRLVLPQQSSNPETFPRLAASHWASSNWVTPLQLASSLTLKHTTNTLNSIGWDPLWYPEPWKSMCTVLKKPGPFSISHLSFLVPSWDGCETGEDES